MVLRWSLAQFTWGQSRKYSLDRSTQKTQKFLSCLSLTWSNIGANGVIVKETSWNPFARQGWVIRDTRVICITLTNRVELNLTLPDQGRVDTVMEAPHWLGLWPVLSVFTPYSWWVSNKRAARFWAPPSTISSARPSVMRFPALWPPTQPVQYRLFFQIYRRHACVGDEPVWQLICYWIHSDLPFNHRDNYPWH